MPRLPPKALDLVCYLYRDEESARRGADFGGTAFLVAVPSALPGRAFFYAVTNWHVACQKGASVLRVNTHDGSSAIFPFGPEEWHFTSRFDIAVHRITLDPTIHRFSYISTELFLLEKYINQVKLGPGDDVFMVGRFIDHDGGPINRPAVRFGNISVMPAPIKQPNDKFADSFCIDLHSRSGYSGSPVFVYRTPGYDLEEPPQSSDIKDTTKILLAGRNYLALLGIHFMQFPEKWELSNNARLSPEISDVPLVRDGKYVKGLSGMTCVLPAWYILDVLNLPQVKEIRDRADAQLAEHDATAGSGLPKAEASAESSLASPSVDA